MCIRDSSYNFQQLRDQLIAQGHQFSTQSDSEVLLHSYEQYGCDFLNQLRGMFAFVIWDSNNKKLFGARDFFGIKPLYYAQMGEIGRASCRERVYVLV